MYECPSFPGGMRLPGYVLAERRRFPDDCLWLRGMLPLKYLPVAPSGDLEVVKTGVFLTSSQVVADGLVVATDASGGKFTKDPRLRRVSWSVVVGRVQDGLFQVLGTMSGLTPPGTSVAHGESYAIVQTIKHTLGQVDLTGDCKPALRTLTKKSFQKTTPAFWGPVWEDRGRIRPTWVKSHLTGREFEIRFGFSQLWRHQANQCADELAGKRAEAASLPTAVESDVSKGSGKTKEVVSLPGASAREAGLAREPAPKPASRAKKKKELPTGQQTLCFKKQ